MFPGKKANYLVYISLGLALMTFVVMGIPGVDMPENQLYYKIAISAVFLLLIVYYVINIKNFKKKS